MGDRRRFDLMADQIAYRFPNRSLSIADVAGGKGMLNAALRQRGFCNVTTWDRRQRGAKGRPHYRYSLFDYRDAPKGYDLVVGMHPDGGTDHIIQYANLHRVPFVLCPCCVIPSAIPYHGNNDYASWIRHLDKIATDASMRVEHLTLRMRGRSNLLIGLPKS